MLQRWWDELLRRVRRQPAAGSGDGAPAAAPRDFTTEREDSRLSNMDAEDQAWQAASLQRDQDTRARDDTPTDPTRRNG